jgi:hypothetical protein
MIIKPKSYVRKRYRTILSYKFLLAKYELPNPSTSVDLYLPFDARYLKIMNFKVGSDLSQDAKFERLTVGVNSDTLTILNSDIVLWYEKIKKGRLFDDRLEAYSSNVNYPRSNDFKEYFQASEYEGLFLHIDSSSDINLVDVFITYEDIDQVGR